MMRCAERGLCRVKLATLGFLLVTVSLACLPAGKGDLGKSSRGSRLTQITLVRVTGHAGEHLECTLVRRTAEGAQVMRVVSLDWQERAKQLKAKGLPTGPQFEVEARQGSISALEMELLAGDILRQGAGGPSREYHVVTLQTGSPQSIAPLVPRQSFMLVEAAQGENLSSLVFADFYEPGLKLGYGTTDESSEFAAYFDSVSSLPLKVKLQTSDPCEAFREVNSTIRRARELADASSLANASAKISEMERVLQMASTSHPQCK